MKLWLRWFLLLGLAGCFTFSQEHSRYAGKESCRSCHAPEQKSVAGTPHEQGRSCEGCHGPGEAHIESIHDRNRIFSFLRASAAEVREQCVQCHKSPTMTQHAVGDVSCIACHSSHHYINKKNFLRPADDTLQHPAELSKTLKVPAG